MHSDSNVPQIVRVWADYYGIEPGDFDPDALPGSGTVIYASDVVASATPVDQGAAIRAHVATIKNTGGVGKIVLPASTSAVPIWIGSKIDVDDLLYLEICGQGDPGLSVGWGTVLRQIVTTEDSEVRIFEASDTSGNGVYYFHDFAMWGAAETWPSFGVSNSNLMQINGAERVTIRNVGGYYCRLVAVVCERCELVEVSGCRFERVVAGIAATDCDRRIITNNTIRNCADDSIACNTNYLAGNPQREPTVITGNLIEDSFGIKIIGGLKAVISGNTISRAKGYGLAILAANGSGFEGESDTTDLVITNNVITDVLQSSKWAPLSVSNAGITISNDNASAPIGAATNPAIRLPELISPVSNAQNSTNAGGQRILIANNIISQTLPQVANYSDWGFGLPYWYDGFTDVSNFNSEFHCQTYGVLLGGSWVDVTIKDNIFERVAYAVAFAVTFGYIGYVGVIGNKIRRAALGAVFANHGSAVKHGKLDIRDNDIDGDPFFESVNRDYVNGTTDTVTISQANPAVITWTTHALPANTAVRFTTTGVLPAGLSPSTTVGARSYYVRSGSTLLTNSFTVSAYPNGPAIATTDAGSGVHTGFSSIPDGSWSGGNSTPYVVDFQDWDGVYLTGNRLRNMNALVVTDTDSRVFVTEQNIVFMEPSTSATFGIPSNSSNKGVRDPYTFLRSGTLVYEDSTPTSATYGETTNRAPARAIGALPTTGFFLAGEFIWNTLYTVASMTLSAGSVVEYGLLGWLRVTTGSNHVLNTDWKEVRSLTGIGGHQTVNAGRATLVLTGSQV